MAADSLETTIATTTLGEIVTRGRLLDLNGNKLAGFVQTYRLWRGSRVLHVEVELDPVEEPKADPWNSYYCVRFAWPDEMAELFRTVNETRQTVTEKQFESPHYVEIVGEQGQHDAFSPAACRSIAGRKSGCSTRCSSPAASGSASFASASASI